MGFDKETAKEAGKKSKRGIDDKIKKIREFYSNFLENNIEKTQEWLDEVAINDPAKAIELLIKMSSLTLPKLKAIELKEEAEPRTYNIINLGVGIDPESDK